MSANGRRSGAKNVRVAHGLQWDHRLAGLVKFFESAPATLDVWNHTDGMCETARHGQDGLRGQDKDK